jgi:bacteriocin biosynthesis cyclodehydratase domain-containing protein
VHPWKTEDVVVPTKPQIKPWYRWLATDGAIVFEHGQTAIVFEGRAAERLLPLLLPILDGSRTVPELVEVLGPAAEPAVAQALHLLAERGLLADGDALEDCTPDGATATETFLAAMSHATSRSTVRAKLVRASVEVVGGGGAAAQVLELLRDSGVRRARGIGFEEAIAGGLEASPPFVVAVPDATEVSRLAEWNRAAVPGGRPWLQVLPFDGRFAAIGPLYVPGETCCYECFRTRRAAASGYGAEYRAIDDIPAEAGGGSAVDAAIAGVAAVVALRWLGLDDHYLPGVFFAYEGGGTALTHHRVYRVPRCAVCSGLREAAPPLPWFKQVELEQVEPEPLSANGAAA